MRGGKERVSPQALCVAVLYSVSIGLHLRLKFPSQEVTLKAEF